MKLNHLALAVTLAVLTQTSALAKDAAGDADAGAPSLVTRVQAALVRGADAAARGIEKGAKAAEYGVRVGLKAAARGIERGAQATARVAESVAKKVEATASPSSGSGS